MSFAQYGIKHLFPTPLVTATLPSGVVPDLNDRLLDLVLRKADEADGVHVSNRGGWQSDDKLPEWGGEPVDFLIQGIRDLIQQVTLHLSGGAFERAEIDWKINGWANINRKNDINIAHTHPGAYWSAVYYVQVCENEAPKTGGELELFDPRGALPLMYCPALRFGIKGYVSAGTSELHVPQAGQCILFPAWLSHAVRPHFDDAVRVSLAFNFSV